jgi:hypothetical protein
MEKITRNICLKWNVEEFRKGSKTPIRRPGEDQLVMMVLLLALKKNGVSIGQ